MLTIYDPVVFTLYSHFQPYFPSPGKRTKTLTLPSTVPKHVNRLLSLETDGEQTRSVNGDVELRCVTFCSGVRGVHRALDSSSWHFSDFSVHLLLSERKEHLIFLFLFLLLLLSSYLALVHRSLAMDSCAFSQSINHGHTFPPWWGIARAITVASILHRKNGSSRSLKDLRTDAAPTVRNSELDLLNKHYFLQHSITASLRLPVCQMWEVGSWNPSLQASTTVSSEWVARSRGGVLPGGGAGRREPRGSSAEHSHCL